MCGQGSADINAAGECSEPGVCLVGGVEVVYDHGGGPDQGRAVAEGGDGHREVGGGSGQRALVEEFPYTGEKRGTREVSAEHQDAGVEQCHHRDKYLADALPGLAGEPHGVGLSSGEMVAHIGTRGGGKPGRCQLFGDGAAAGDSCQTAVGAAHAECVGTVVEPDVADVARSPSIPR